MIKNKTKGGDRTSYNDWTRNIVARQTSEHRHEKRVASKYETKQSENVFRFDISSELKAYEFLLGANISTINCRRLGAITGHYTMMLRRAH